MKFLAIIMNEENPLSHFPSRGANARKHPRTRNSFLGCIVGYMSVFVTLPNIYEIIIKVKLIIEYS